MKMTCACPVDGCPCQSPFFRAIGKKGALQAKRAIPASMRAEYGKRPTKEGRRPRGRPRIKEGN